MKQNTATFEEVFTKAGIIPQWIERGRQEGIEQGIERGIERGRQEGIEQGIEQGIERGREKIVRRLFAMGMPIAEIAQATELPVEKIRALTSE